MHKVLALDLDGTVLNSEHRISNELRATIQALKPYVHVVLVTGRHHTAAKPYYAELELTSPIICCNGTYVYDYANQAVIEHNAIGKAQARDFIQIAEGNDLKLVMYVQDAMLYSRSQPVAYMDRLLRWAETVQIELRNSSHRHGATQRGDSFCRSHGRTVQIAHTATEPHRGGGQFLPKS